MLRKVLIADPTDGQAVTILSNAGIQVVTRTGSSPSVKDMVQDGFDGLVVRSATQVTEEVIKNSPSLKVIGRAGVGTDNIDVGAASRAGILVLNAPSGNTIAATELTCGLILALARNIWPACSSLKVDAKWDRKSFQGTEVAGKTLAIIGLGRIGREVGTRMAAFGMNLIGFDPLVTKEQCTSFGIEWFPSIDELLPRADYITLHVPLIPGSTRNLINDSTLSACKDGVKVINVARGGIVDESALLRALNSGKVGGAALDVFSAEPPTESRELIEHPRVLVTPHLGASTAEAQVRVATEIAHQFVALKEAMEGGKERQKGDIKQKLTGVVNGAILDKLLS